MRNNLLEAALKYKEMGLSVIPVKQDKKPLIKWEAYQRERADNEQIKEWWHEWPNANVAIVTGEISGVDVVDADSEDGKGVLEDYIPDSLILPISKTPRGYHYFFKHKPGLMNGTKVLNDCDLRTNGGYIIVPPSNNGNGEAYAWESGLSLHNTSPASMPEMLFDILQQGAHSQNANSSEHVYNNMYTSTRGENNNQAITTITNHNKHNISFDEGSRDETLFHIANCLVKGGMGCDNILKCLLFLGSNCSVPFPEKEIQAKVESAFKRLKKRKGNLTQEIRDWISITWHSISITDALLNITNITNADRPKVTVIMNRLVKEGILERVPNKNGVYRKVDTDVEAMDFLNAETESVNLWLPFNLHKMVDLMPGNIIVIAGEPNAGKTAFLLNVIRQNMSNFKIHYFNSEMGSSELKKRLNNFDDIALSDWKFNAYERSDNFADVIKQGNGNINIIDYLEIHDNFYEVGGKLAEIHKKLKGAIAIVALQKNQGVDVGLGGFRGLEKPRLYLSMAPNALKIVKAKNWKASENPNGKQIRFKLAAGCKLIKQGDWHKDLTK